MKALGFISILTLATGLLSFSANLFSHGQGPGSLMVTRHFTGAWEQTGQESQGLSLEVIGQFDDSRKSVAYWYTYGADRKTAWYLGIGNLVENRIEMELYDSTDVGFMQDEEPGNDSVQNIGTMTIVFDSCNSGAVTFETNHAEVGNGSFDITRVSEVLNTHCSGGPSDDMHADAMFGVQRMDLAPAREGITGNGYARYEDYPGHMEFEVEVSGLPDGDYHLYVGMQDRGGMTVANGYGRLDYRSPGETGSEMLNFEPRDMLIEIHDNQGVVLSSFENRFTPGQHGQYGDNDDPRFRCGPGQ